jgi:hypothetical protein
MLARGKSGPRGAFLVYAGFWGRPVVYGNRLNYEIG